MIFGIKVSSQMHGDGSWKIKDLVAQVFVLMKALHMSKYSHPHSTPMKILEARCYDDTRDVNNVENSST